MNAVNLKPSSSQEIYLGMLNKVSYLSGLIDLNNLTFDQTWYDNFVGHASHGQKIMAQFFAAVWYGENHFKFDLIEAVAVLDYENKQIVVEWIQNPVWP